MHDIRIYKNSFVKKKSYINPKVITFDLDETMGSFGDLYVLWKGISSLFPLHHPDVLFEKIVDIYPEFLRTGILNILSYLYNKKKSNQCSKVFLYTNNQCYGSYNSKWISFIVDYIHKKICTDKMVLFDKIICAFKINNQIIEPLRTTHNKTYNDFIRCTLLPRTAEICFIDNTYFSKMSNSQVYYIQPRSYSHKLSHNDIVTRFMDNYSSFGLPHNSYSIMQDWFSNINIGSQIIENKLDDITVSKKIMYHLKEFFLMSIKGKKTKKIKMRFGKFTRKTRT